MLRKLLGFTGKKPIKLLYLLFKVLYTTSGSLDNVEVTNSRTVTGLTTIDCGHAGKRGVVLITEVPNVSDIRSGDHFLRELCCWWSQKCLTMGKNRAKDIEGNGDVSPSKLSKVGEPSTSGHSSKTPDQPQQADMLSALTGIGEILKGGFASLENKVVEVGNNINKLDTKMVEKLDSLVEGVDLESGGESEVDTGVDTGVVNGAAAVRQGAHDLSDGEIVESPVLSATLKEMASDESVGAPVKENVADFVRKAFEKPVKGDNAKKFKDRLSVPKNVECLIVPRVNEPIFIKLSTTAKNKDRAVQDSQVTFMKVASALVRITDALADHEKEGQWVTDAMQMAADAITLTATLQEGWLKARREDIKPSLPDDFKRLASVEVPLTAKHLFGDDLEGAIKSVENTNKLAKKMDSDKKPKPQGGQKPFKQQYKKKKNFYKNKNNKDTSNNGDKKKDFHKKGSRN